MRLRIFLVDWLDSFLAELVATMGDLCALVGGSVPWADSQAQESGSLAFLDALLVLFRCNKGSAVFEWCSEALALQKAFCQVVSFLETGW